MVRFVYSKRNNSNLLVADEQAMANTFLQFMLRSAGREVQRDLSRKIRGYTVRMVPEPLRKIVGWILLIFGAVALLGTWTAGMFWLWEYEVILINAFIVSIGSIGWGITLLRHKG